MNGATIFIGIFWLIGLGLLGYAGYSAYLARQAENWPTANGTLTICDFKTSTDSDGDNTYRVNVRYNYAVHGRQYENTKLAFGYAGSSNRGEHSAIYDKLRSAPSVSVRYDPANPSRSVLAAGVHGAIQFMLVFAITWLAFIAGFTVMKAMSAQRGSSVADRIVVAEMRNHGKSHPAPANQ